MGEPLLLTTLSASWGRQSTWLLWEMILGLRPVPENFVALTADPGMEKRRTYEYQNWMVNLCRENGIETRVCEGRNLFLHLTEEVPALKTRAREAFTGNDEQWEKFLDSVGRTPGKGGERQALYRGSIGFIPRLDQPAFFVKHANGKRGKLRQACTREFKITPLRREIRRILYERYEIHPSGGKIPGVIETWIGFAMDEQHRVKPSDRKYIALRHPLIEAGLDRPTIDGLYVQYGVPIPPSSVCNGCFSNGLGTFSQMHAHAPDDFEQACRVDDAVRDLRLFGISNPVYVSPTLLPLRQLAAMKFDLGDPWETDKFSCDSGVCFL